jgi:FixJ family two-component response regulator
VVREGKIFGRCVVVDDDPDILLSARLLLRDLFNEVATFEAPADAMPSLVTEGADVILLDANFGRGATNAAEGFHWLGEYLKHDPQAVVVMITAHGGVNIAVEAMKRGATDFVSKPWSNERLLATVRTAASLRSSRQAVAIERKRAVAIAAPAAGAETPLLGTSAAMHRVYQSSTAARAAPTTSWSPSISARLPRTCSIPNCSATLGVLSPTPAPTASAASRPRTAARSSWTRSATSPSTSSPSSSPHWSSAASSRSAPTSRSPSTFG